MNNDLKKMALLGVTAGVMMTSPGAVFAASHDIQENMGTLLAGGCGGGKCSSKNNDNSSNKRNNIIADNTSYNGNNAQLMTEDQLKSQLDSQGKERYENLSPEGKAEAIRIGSQSCKGQNSCKGTGGCKTAQHTCKGANSCAGQGGCAMKDKNDAVKLAEDKQAAKRNDLNGGSY